jgi:hypothetical protein
MSSAFAGEGEGPEGEIPPLCEQNAIEQSFAVTEKITALGQEVFVIEATISNPSDIVEGVELHCAFLTTDVFVEWDDGTTSSSVDCTDVFLLPGESIVCEDIGTWVSNDSNGPSPFISRLHTERDVFVPNGPLPDSSTTSDNTVLVLADVEFEKSVDPSKILDGVETEVEYSYFINNVGDADLDCTVFDDQLGPIGGVFLSGGASDTLFADAVISTETTNIATVTCEHQLGVVEDEDTVTVTTIDPSILVEKVCTPELQGAPGDITWTITVTNNGNVPLTVQLQDIELAIDVALGEIAAGDNVVTVVDQFGLGAGIYTNSATATGEHQLGVVEDNDTAECEIEELGQEGLTPGFWKANAEQWGAGAWVSEDPTDSFNARFGTNVELKLSKDDSETDKGTSENPTLYGALGALGGGENALARHCVAAKLNVENPDVDYPMSLDEVIEQCAEALNGGDKEAINELKDTLDEYNNLGADISQHWPN